MAPQSELLPNFRSPARQHVCRGHVAWLSTGLRLHGSWKQQVAFNAASAPGCSWALSANLKQLCATKNCTHKPLRGPCIETCGTTGILKARGRSHGVSHPQHPTTTAQHLPTQPTRLPTQLLRSPRCLGDCTIINATEQRDAGHAGRLGNGTGCEQTK